MKIEIDESILDFTLITCAFNKEIKFWTIRDVINLIKTVQARERRKKRCVSCIRKNECAFYQPKKGTESS